MVVYDDISPLAELRRSGHGSLTPAGIYLDRRDDSLVIEVSYEEDFLTFRLCDFTAH
jgi:hypothetical protein